MWLQITAVPGQEEGLGQVPDPELAHQIGTVEFDRPDAEAELMGDGLVRSAVGEGKKHLSLPGSQQGESASRIGPGDAELLERLLDGGDQVGDPERLLDEIDDPEPAGADRGGDAAVSGGPAMATSPAPLFSIEGLWRPPIRIQSRPKEARMPTLAELKTRIVTETNRDDMGAGGELETLLADAIARAIEFHADELFWFNRASAAAETVAESATVAIPSDLRIALSVSCDGTPLRKIAVEDIAGLSGSGRPLLWAEDDGAIRLWPVPDSVYALALAGIAELGVPEDTNEWTEAGCDLIAARVRMLLFRDSLRDLDGVQLAASAEDEALSRLRRETRRRGRLAAATDPALRAAGRSAAI